MCVHVPAVAVAGGLQCSYLVSKPASHRARGELARHRCGVLYLVIYTISSPLAYSSDAGSFAVWRLEWLSAVDTAHGTCGRQRGTEIDWRSHAYTCSALTPGSHVDIVIRAAVKQGEGCNAWWAWVRRHQALAATPANRLWACRQYTARPATEFLTLKLQFQLRRPHPSFIQDAYPEIQHRGEGPGDPPVGQQERDGRHQRCNLPSWALGCAQG